LERISGVAGAHASFTLEDDTLDALSDLADRFSTGIHIHVAEDRSDQEDSLRRCGRRVTHRLDDAGILRPRSIAAHVIHVDRNELEVLKQRETWLVHNCRSNLNNSVGRAPILQFGKRSALGTDGIDGDMMAESRTAYFRAREEALDAFAEQFTDLLGRGGELASQFFPAPVGRLEEGAVADLVILDYDPPTPLTSENIAWHWMFAMTPKYVKSVMVDGAWVVRNGEFCNVDEERIRAEARTQARSLWKRMEDL
jgi:cytosine/adenosine deaminase-related metal-dependent hydrolase